MTTTNGHTACETQVQDLKNETQSIEQKTKDLKAKYYEMLIQNVKKDAEIEELEKEVARIKRFEKFEPNFSKESMETLLQFGNTKQEDSPFILAAVRGLYEHRLDVLQTKSMSGRSKKGEKTAVTPEKKKVLEGIFRERIESDGKFVNERKRKLNNLVKSALEQLNKKQ